MKSLSRSDLSPDQLKVYQSMLDWVRTPASSLLTIGGFAGVGKSSLLGLFASEMKHLRIAYVCFTGRASSIVGRKLEAAGVPTTNKICTDDFAKLGGHWKHLFYSPKSQEAAFPFCGTIHRFLYKPVIDSITEELLFWNKREELDRNYDLVVIDEASMISAQIISDIQAHGVRVMAVGDHGQLPPVMGDGSLIARPMLRLEKIHRQAEGSPIIKLSRVIREEGRLDQSLADGDRLRFGVRAHANHPRLAELFAENPLETAVLCWRNRTRIDVNRSIRKHRGYEGKPPQDGEVLISLKNYPPVYNGMRGLLHGEVKPMKEWWLLRGRLGFPDEGIEPSEFEMCRDQFHREKPFDSLEDLKAAGMKAYSMSDAGRLIDFGYAMTVHKSQGSQFKQVIVVADWRPDYSQDWTRRMAYTAVTRSSERLTVLV